MEMWNPLEDFFGVRFMPTFVPAIILVFRHSDYDTLHDMVIEPAVTLARNMGLGVQGPAFLPTASMVRSARVLVRGSATELVRYTKAVELLPRYGAQVDIRLERIMEMVVYGTGQLPAREAYRKAKSQDWKAFDEAKTRDWKTHEEARDSLWKAYSEARAQTRKAYEEAKAQTEKEHREAKASALDG